MQKEKIALALVLKNLIDTNELKEYKLTNTTTIIQGSFKFFSFKMFMYFYFYTYNIFKIITKVMIFLLTKKNNFFHKLQ